MNAITQIQRRFHFVLPDDYERFWSAGLLLNDKAVGIPISRHFWLSPDDIAGCRWPSYMIRSLVPCARTPGRDHFCWFVESTGDSWIADCPRDSDFGVAVAPHFEAFVFRSLLEEFADSWITQLEEAAFVFRTYVHRVSSVMRPDWVAILAEYASRSPSLNKQNRPGVISKQELSDVIGREIAFGALNKQFKQHSD